MTYFVTQKSKHSFINYRRQLHPRSIISASLYCSNSISIIVIIYSFIISPFSFIFNYNVYNILFVYRFMRITIKGINIFLFLYIFSKRNPTMILFFVKFTNLLLFITYCIYILLCINIINTY